MLDPVFSTRPIHECVEFSRRLMYFSPDGGFAGGKPFDVYRLSYLTPNNALADPPAGKPSEL